MNLRWTPAALAAAASLALGACSSSGLQKEPYANIKKGTTSIGISTGWAAYKADVDAQIVSGPLAGASGSDTSDLQPQWGVALKGHHWLTDNFALGLIIERRSFDPDPVMPLAATLDPGSFQTWHFLASSRYWFGAFTKSKRWKPFIGLDLGYIPEVKLNDILVTYPSPPFPAAGTENVDATGSSYWTIAPVVGLNYLISDNWTLDVGAFYEWSLNSSDASIDLTIPGIGATQVDAQVTPYGLIGFIGVTYYM